MSTRLENYPSAIEDLRREIDQLIDKHDAARKAGFALNDWDKQRLLGLLLKERLLGTATPGYEVR